MIIGKTKVSSEHVWQAWTKVHPTLIPGAVGTVQDARGRKIAYHILEVNQGKSFSISWKALFVRLIFSYEVAPLNFGSEIRYGFKLVGPFAWIVRWWISPKICANLDLVLKAFIKHIESGQ